MSERRAVFVSGVGVVSAAGETTCELLEAVRSGRSLSGEITAFEPAAGEPTRAVEAPEFDLARHVPSVKSYIDRTSALALAAARMALVDAGLDEADSRKGELGLAYGTQWGCLDSMEIFFGKLKSGNPRFAPPLPFSHSYANSPASVLAIELALRGDHRVYSTGRLSGAWALLGGADAVALGAADAVVCVASDAFTRSAFRHYFSANRLLPDDVPDGARSGRRRCPDDAARSGRRRCADDAARDERDRFLLGEGAACLVLEAKEHARARGKDPKAALLGAGVARGGDSASVLERAARDALSRADVAPGNTDNFIRRFIGASLTSAGAKAEIEAAARVVEAPGEVTEDTLKARFLSTGPVLGETMGASGLLAAAAGCACLDEGPVLVLAADGPSEGSPGLSTAIAALFGPAPHAASAC